MIGRRVQRKVDEQKVEPKGFDDFDLRLGDIMRGERATMGKSLLDVQRELRIKAAYIAAIENCDPSAFDTPGFIAGYVRSYARYLGMDPDAAYESFCKESGFSVAHGMSQEASVVRKAPRAARNARREDDMLGLGSAPFVARDSFLSEIEPRAIGSVLVLVALISGLGYGGWSVLRQVQQVQLAPVDQAPVVLSDIDPLRGSGGLAPSGDDNFAAPSVEALDRLYRPQALDVPVLVARDAPISTLDPRSVGNFTSPQVPGVVQAEAAPEPAETVPQVVESVAPHLKMVAVRPAWVRVRAADGTVIFEGIMEPGQAYDVPQTEEPPTLRVGESGAIYFDVDGTLFGPVGPRGTVTAGFAMSREAVTTAMSVADLRQDDDLARMVAEARAAE